MLHLIKILLPIAKDYESSHLRLQDGSLIDLKSVDLVWWRRVRADQQLGNYTADDYQIRLINNDCRGALNGALESHFRGR